MTQSKDEILGSFKKIMFLKHSRRTITPELSPLSSKALGWNQEKDCKWGACRHQSFYSVSPSAIPRVSSLPDGLTVSTGPNGAGRAQGLGGGGRSAARLWTHTSRFLRVSRIWNFMINNRERTLEKERITELNTNTRFSLFKNQASQFYCLCPLTASCLLPLV